MGIKETAITSSEKKLGPPTSLAAPMTTSLKVPELAFRFPTLKLFMRLLDDHDGSIDHRADGDRNSRERHDVRGEVHPYIGIKEIITAMAIVRIGTPASESARGRRDDEANDDQLLVRASFKVSTERSINSPRS